MSYFDEFFEASYHEKLNDSGYSKEELKKMAKSRIMDLVDGITINDVSIRHSDEGLPTEMLLEALSDCMTAKFEYESISLLAHDFALDGKINCVSRSSIMISALDFLEEKKILKKLKAKFTPVHAWLSYKTMFGELDIDSSGEQSKKRHPLSTISVACIENRVAKLSEKGYLDEVIESCDQVIESGVLDANVYGHKSNALTMFYRFEEALGMINEGLKKDPDSHNMEAYRGVALANLGRYEDSISCLEGVLSGEGDARTKSFSRYIIDKIDRNSRNYSACPTQQMLAFL